MAVHQESEFVFENSGDEETDSSKIYYNRSITDRAYQIFLFDEYAELVSQFEVSFNF